MLSAVKIVLSLAWLLIAVLDWGVVFFGVEVCEERLDGLNDVIRLSSLTLATSLDELLKFRRAVSSSVWRHGGCRSKDDVAG